jgi:glucan phosphoethanolaminetransferase (alkaline phosphatase superfamily)
MIDRVIIPRKVGRNTHAEQINSKVMCIGAWMIAIIIGIAAVSKVQHVDIGDNGVVFGLLGTFSLIAVCWFSSFSSGSVIKAIGKCLIGVILGGAGYWTYAYFVLDIKITLG